MKTVVKTVTDSPFAVGERVHDNETPQHTGFVKAIGKTGMVCIRWHKGFSAWEEPFNLVKTDDATHL